MVRATILSFAILSIVFVVAACAQPPRPTPSPTASPTPVSPPPAETAAAFHVDGTVREHCGSLGGCAYFAELMGPDGPWRAEFAFRGEAGLAIVAGLPAVLLPGDYTLTLSSNLVSDAILNGVRQLGPVDSTCLVDFTVAQGQRSMGAHGSFATDTCSVETMG